jgi:hypothetical protein
MTMGEMIGSDWRVFFDGVEVPHQGVSVNFVVDQISQAQIMMEPDRVLANLRPQTVVSIWTKERFIKGQRVEKSLDEQLKNDYFLYWEGLTTGVTHSKSPSERSMMVSCEALMGPLSRVGGFSLNLGAIPNSELLTGSFLPSVPEGAVDGDINMLQLVASEIATDAGTDMTKVTFAALTTLLSHNGIGRLQERRYQLLSRLRVVNNATLASIIAPSAQASPFRSMAHTGDLGPTATVLNVLTHINSYVFYRLTQVPAPTPRDLKNGYARLDTKPKEAPANERFVATFLRNEYISLPDMYYTAPPPCNFIFPDMLTSLQVTRQFYAEPTRTALIDSVTGGRAIYLAPSTISPTSGSTSSEAFSYIPQRQFVESSNVNYKSAYSIKVGEGDEERNVKSLANVTAYELEKGIVMKTLQPDVSMVFAQALRFDATNQSSAQERAVTAYDLFLKGVADFRHELARLNRTIQVSMVGHRNLVPGFTAVIFDADVSYMGYVESCSFMVDPSGRESTQVSLSRARPMPTGDMESVEEKVTQALSSLTEENQLTLDSAVGTILFQTGDAIAMKDAVLTVTNFQVNLYRVLAPTLELLDLPFPVFTGGLALDTPEALDELYSDLLGCKPFYTGPYMPKAPKPDQTRDFLVGPLLTLIRSIQALDAVFASNPDRNRAGLPKSYQQVASTQTIGQGTFEWQHANFLDRERLYMSRYLADHGLSLSVRNATAGIKVQGMEPRRFAVMAPADRGRRVGTLRFDDSLFCKLPNDHQLMRADEGDTGRSDSGINNTQSLLGSLGGLDKELLTTAGRQKFMLNYSNKHFGSRAFDGS